MTKSGRCGQPAMNAPNPFELRPPVAFDSLAQACAGAHALAGAACAGLDLHST